MSTRSSASALLEKLSTKLSDVMLRHRPALEKKLGRLQRTGAPKPAQLQQISQEIESSVREHQQRLTERPLPIYDENLPVNQRKEEIAALIRDHQVVIIAGETGSGKTTQIPKICLELGLGSRGYIGHTQPRRIAARTIASRISSELGTPLGETVGYKIRFQDKVGSGTCIKIMTDGMLLAEIQHDRNLLAYDTLIIDEAHERSLNIDFILGYLKRLLPKRQDLKLIITSATIDTERFSRHFDNAPIMEVSGRTFPVEVRYRPPMDSEQESDRTQIEAILDAVKEICRTDRQGHILVFLAGEREIRETAEALRKHHPPHIDILPLYSRLATGEQNRIFRQGKRQRVILATNVAETSLTVPGIAYVVDPGTARISRYNYRSKVQRLPVESISQASADQRKGRCGRISDGVCFRLYSQDDYLSRFEFTQPEILRTSLASVILQMQSLDLGSIEKFPFLEPPESRMVKEGYQVLTELGALGDDRVLTRLGRQLGRLPIDPQIGRMILAARDENCITEILIIASALSVQDPREYPHDSREKSNLQHRQHADEKSDFISYINLWRFYHRAKDELPSENQLRKFCKKNMISYMRFREWREVHHQLYRLIREMGIKYNQADADYDAIHRALLSGLLPNVGSRVEKNEYLGARNSRFHVFPGSALFKKPPPWILAAEKVETGKVYARCVASVEPEWIERIAGNLCRRHYFEPHWQKRKGQVGAYEQVSLWGLNLVQRRRINFGPIDPQVSREIFIRSALVEGIFHSKAPFFDRNQKIRQEIETLEAKSRKRDILIDEEEIYAFYDSKIPENIYNTKAFDRWYRDASKEDPELLFLSRNNLMKHSGENIDPLFPGFLDHRGIKFELRYRLDPGHPCDGITLIVPLAVLGQLHQDDFEWLVPGMLREKITLLIKRLPKSQRRSFVPVPDYVNRCLEQLTPGEGKLSDRLGRLLQDISGIELPAEIWASDQLPDHLRMNFRVIDQDGAILDESRDLAALKDSLIDQRTATIEQHKPTGWDRQELTDWDFDQLPESIALQQHGVTIQYHPALVDRNTSVDLVLFDDAGEAKIAGKRGLNRLYRLRLAKQIRQLHRDIPKFDKLCLWFAPTGNRELLLDDLINALFEHVFLSQPQPRTREDFEERIQLGKSQLHPALMQLSEWLLQTLSLHHEIGKCLKGSLNPQKLEALADIQDQLGHLVYPGFISATPFEQLQHLPRYLKAISSRLTKLDNNPTKDRRQLLEIAEFWREFKALNKNQTDPDNQPNQIRYRWMLEEFRVSLFAQELKTAYPISAQRLKKQREMLKR